MASDKGDNLETVSGKDHLVSQVKHTLKLSTDYALGSVRPDGHWCGELRSNVTITAEYVFLQQALGLDLQTDRTAYCRYILSEQNSDGSWGLAPGYAGDVSTTTEAYLALKLLGTSTETPAMQRAQAFTLTAGGVARVRVFTRIFLATFGLFPWDAVPQLPVELILLPSSCPINIYTLASWARGTIAPLLIICHHRPVYALPDDYLDELWQNPTNKNVPYGSSIWELLSQRDIPGLAFTAVDRLLYQLGGLRSIPLLRSYARRQCIKWILERQEPTGDWAGIFPPMHASVYAFVLEGYKLDDPPVRLGIQAIENFAWEDEQGKRIQPCVSPVWDTALMSIGLCDAMSHDRQTLDQAITWIRNRQLLEPRGDWRVYRPQLAPGGFSFEYENSHYPDVDDTAAIILAQVKHDARSINSDSVIAAATWILGMQNPDGGWAAFDVENDKLFLNKIPFSDMDSLCDTSCADITGRILEAFGLMMTHDSEKTGVSPMLRAACTRGVTYLASTQEPSGAWLGRWGCNYIYGTSHALCGLSYFVSHDERVSGLVNPALQWIKSKQNADGGWGESLLSYRSPDSQQQHQESTASQTAWALMGLLAHLPVTDAAIECGIRWLVSAQRPEKGIGVSWPEAAIVPLRYWDDLDYLRRLCHDFTFRFDDVLDVAKLEGALARLMEIGDWGQLGARLRLNDSGHLEYHVPAEYTKTRPGFNFTTTEYGLRQDQSVLLPSPALFAPLVRHADSPRELADWIYSDRPQLHIHVALFEDATLVTISYVHTLFDAIARTTFFKAWIAVLRGREDEVPDFIPFDHDPLCTLGSSASAQRYSNFGRVVRGVGLVVFGLRYLFDLLWFWKEEEHPIRLPGRCVDRLRETARKELAAATPSGGEAPFVSEGDVVVAWWVRTMVTALNPRPHRTIMVMNVFNVWALFDEWFPTGGAGFIGNAFFYSYTLLVANQVLQDTKLGHVASRNRQALMEHRTRDQVQAMTAIQRASLTRTPPVVGDANLLFMACTNQHKARYFELDFSAAVVSPGLPLSERPHALGRPSYINDIEHCRAYPTRNVVRIIGKDAAGDYWLLFKTRPAAWPAIHRQLMDLLKIDERE
ncbi:squalene cyclase [Aspergillus ibericus CBS 121593]|uniref:Squalene cyclase n=1 Tax=Aspergillus ibericus CBS 121593 TaxID=1448316 RepID=A0A395GTC3_9EURO|nr:squalene cyclase [Aspergillus ibericus CBS 121593]RAK98676.1 squalene cyclase [Aspergillus ibericus CBS 121593]